MAVQIDIDLGYEFHTPAALTQVWSLLSNLPAASQHFPHLERLVDEGNHVYRWELRPIGNEHVGLQTVYASQYHYTPPHTPQGSPHDLPQARIEWQPVSGVGNAEIGGHWQLISHVHDQSEGTQLALRIHGLLHLPVPSLMKPLVAPLVLKEFEMLIKQYIDNLLQHFAPPPEVSAP